MNKLEILNLNYEDFCNYLKKITYKERLDLLNDKEVLLKIFLLDSSQNVWKFDNMTQLYKAEDLLSKMDNNLISKISDLYPYYEYVYLIILKRANQEVFEQYLKNNNYLLKLLLFKGESFYSELNFSCGTVLHIIKYLEENNINNNDTCLYYIITSSIKNKTDQEKYLNSNINIFYKKMMFTFFDHNLVSNFIKHNLVNFTNKEIINILMYSEIVIDYHLYYNEDFFRKMILSNSFFEMRSKLNTLSNNIDTDYYEKLISKMEDNLINNYKTYHKFITDDSSLIEKDYINGEYINRSIQDSKILLKLIFDKLFQDNVRNVCLNIEEIISFNNNLTFEKLTFYKELTNLLNKDIEYILNFYDKYKGTYEVNEYYDDIRKTKNKSYQLLKSSCLHISDINYLKNDDLSKKYNIPIYELNGEKFYMLVTCRSRIPNGNNSVPRNCYSLIGYNNMKVFDESKYIYGFDNFDINKIIHIYENDSYSLIGEKNTTKFVNRIRTPDEILSSNKMNEIQIKNEKINNQEYERLFPTYVVCFNELNEKSIDAASKLNIPLIIIHKEKYHFLEESKHLSNNDEKYTSSLVNEMEYKSK